MAMIINFEREKHDDGHVSEDNFLWISGKFVGITVQSGCSGAPWAIQQSPKKHAESLAAKLNCPLHPTSDLVDCLRTFTPNQIMKVWKWNQRRARE